MNTTLFTAILASGLALALSREHRIRRAFQTLAARLLDKLRQPHSSRRPNHPHTTGSFRRTP
jgi:hypothetical protein